MNEKVNSYLVTGAVHKVGEVVNVSDSFKKRQLVIVTEERYPQYLNTQLTQDKVELLDNLKVGDVWTLVKLEDAPNTTVEGPTDLPF